MENVWGLFHGNNNDPDGLSNGCSSGRTEPVLRNKHLVNVHQCHHHPEASIGSDHQPAGSSQEILTSGQHPVATARFFGRRASAKQ
jgi:hypothetical protein